MLPLLGRSITSHTAEALRLHGRRSSPRVNAVRHLINNTEEPKLTKSDAVKFHTVQHFSVEKTPITAQLWMQRMAGRESISTSSTSNSNLMKEPLKIEESAPTFLLDKTSKESRLTIRYNFSQDGE